MSREGDGWRGAAGLLVALAALARPNLALVGLAWCAVELVRRRLRAAAVLAAGMLVVLVPVGLRNLAASGHFVPISANGGLTLYHGNGPGAQGFFGPLPPGFSGDVALQRNEATRLASAAAGSALDPVAADDHWGKLALRARWEDPWGTVRLLARRLLLTLDDREAGLDYAASLDANPWRRGAPVPFALLLALAAGGLVAHGVRERARWPAWAALVACAATPVCFYVSSRYRLPMSALLVVPAAWGLAALRPPRLGRIAVAAVLVAALSWTVPWTEPAVQRVLGSDPEVLRPYRDLWRVDEAESLIGLGTAYWRAGRMEEAEQRARRAAELEPRSADALDLLGVALEGQGRTAEAEAAYREALAAGSDVQGRVSAASNLAALLIRRQEDAAAVPILEEALRLMPLDPNVWGNLLVALYNSGQNEAAREALGRARAAGVPVDAELSRAIEAVGRRP